MRIQRVAAGLIDFLNLRSQGETPDELARLVRPTLSLEDFYDMERHESATEPVAMNAGQIEFIQVPDDEVWKLLAVAMQRDPRVTDAAGESFQWTFSVERNIGADLNGVPFHTSPVQVYPGGLSVTTVVAYAFLLPRPFLLRPGQRLTTTLQFDDVPGSGTTFVGDFWAHIVRMKV